MSIYLIQKVTYKTKRPVYDLRTIAEVEGAGVKAGKHAEWREQIIVPPLPQTALAGCSLIDIDYFIQVRVCVCFSSELPNFIIFSSRGAHIKYYNVCVFVPAGAVI